MPQTARSRRRSRRPGKVAAKVLCVVAERRRLLAIKADLQADYDRELEALRTSYAAPIARIDVQLRNLDRGLLPQPMRETDVD